MKDRKKWSLSKILLIFIILKENRDIKTEFYYLEDELFFRSFKNGTQIQ